MLDSKRAKGNIKLGVNSAAGTVMTHKQGKVCISVCAYVHKYLSEIFNMEEKNFFNFFS